jgi:soluble lytic murein transglycosylase-like protein
MTAKQCRYAVMKLLNPHRRSWRVLPGIFMLFSGLFTSGPCPADIYAFTADDGTVHLSNVPTDSRYETIVKAPNQPVGHGAANGIMRAKFQPLVSEAARANDVDEALLHAVIEVESGYNPAAVSPKGAVGLMQLMPKTALRYNVANAYDSAQNIRGGAHYLRDLMNMFKNDLQLTLAAYNAGEEAVKLRGNRIPPYRETQRYVPRVLELYQRIKSSGGTVYY